MSARLIDVEGQARAGTLRFFAGHEQPFFNLVAPLRVGALKAWCADQGCSFTAACWHAVTWAANGQAPFRQRLREGQLWEHDRIHLGTTVLRDDDTFGFCYFDYLADFAAFEAAWRQRTAEFRAQRTWEPSERDDILRGSVVPWVPFTSVQHARRCPEIDSVPRFVVGGLHEREGELVVPLSVEVHHALVDGLHVGRYFAALQQRVAEPGGW